MNFSDIHIKNLQYRGGRTFRFRKNTSNTNGQSICITEKIDVPLYCDTGQMVKNYLEEKRAEIIINRCSYVDGSAKLFSTILEEYIKSYEIQNNNFSIINDEFINGKRGLSKKTIETYKEMLPRVNAFFEKKKLKDINSADIENFMRKMSNPDMVNNTLFRAKNNLLDLFNKSGKTNNYYEKEMKINHNSLKALRSGGNVSLKTAHKVSGWFKDSIENLFTEVKITKSLSSKTINNYYAFLSSVFSWAIKKDYIETNPCKKVNKFPLTTKKRVSIDKESIKKLFESLDKEKDIVFKTQIYILFFCGCRRGEMLGLQYNNIDLKNSTITFEKSVLCGKNGCYISTTKTGKTRTMKVSDSLIKCIKEYKEYEKSKFKKMKLELKEEQYLFYNQNMGLYNPDTFNCKFRRFNSKYELKKLGINALKLRHNYATVLLEAGEIPYHVSKDMGHSSPNTTFRYYADAIELGNQKNLSNEFENQYAGIF